MTHRYRVRAVTPDGVRSDWSGWSATLQLQAPPAAPANLAPNGAAVDASLPVVLSWLHMPVDGTAQTRREVRYRLAGDVTWTTSDLVTSAQSLDASVLDAGSWEWQVRTWGAHADPSVWSALATITVANAPAVTITSPDPTVKGSSVTVEWLYVQPDGQPQSGFEVQVTDGATVLASSGVQTGSGLSWLSPQVLADGADLAVQVRARASLGLWSQWATLAIAVEYAPPAQPLLDVEWVPEMGHVRARATAQAGGGELDRNLLANPSGEVNAVGWYYGFIETGITRDATVSETGAASIKATCLTDNGLEAMGAPQGMVAGETYTVIARVRGSKVLDVNLGEYFGTVEMVTVTPDWSWVSVTFACQQPGQKVGICNGDAFGPDRPMAGDNLWIDRMAVCKGGVYFDGDTADSGGVGYLWLGTPHESQSVMIDPTGVDIVDTDTVALQRSIDGSEWVTLGTDASSVDVIDYEVPLSGSLRYRAISTSALPSTAEQDIDVVSPHDAGNHAACGVWLNAGPDFTTAVILPSNIDATETVGGDKDLRQYEARPLPVGRESMHVGRSFMVRVDLLDDPHHPSPLVATRDRLREIARTKGVALYRDPDGTMIYCQVSPITMGRPITKDGVSPISFGVTEVDTPTGEQLSALSRYQPTRIVEVRPGEFAMTGPGLTEKAPGEFDYIQITQ